MSLTTKWFSRCGSADAFAHNCPLISLLSGIGQRVPTVPNLCVASGIFDQPTTIVLFLCHHSPEYAGHFVGQCNGSQRAFFPFKQATQPAVLFDAFPPRPPDTNRSSRDQQSPEIGLAHFADPAQLGLATR